MNQLLYNTETDAFLIEQGNTPDVNEYGWRYIASVSRPAVVAPFVRFVKDCNAAGIATPLELMQNIYRKFEEKVS